VVVGKRPLLGLNCIDTTEWMGGVIYIQNLLYALGALPPDERPRVRLMGPLKRDSAAIRSVLEHEFVEYHRGQVQGEGTALANLLYRLYRGVCRRIPYVGDPQVRGLDAVFPAFAASPWQCSDIFWIPDFQSEHLPHLFTEQERALRRAGAARIAQSEGTLVLSSAAALADFQALFPDARVQTAIWRFCTTLPPEAPARQDPRLGYRIPRKYLYIANQFWAHKDHMTAFAALKILVEQGLDVQIVCTGLESDRRSLPHAETLRRYVAETGLVDRVHFLGLVPRGDQIEIFRHAAAVLQPSLFEGWSTVVEDAKAIGRPIVLSDIPVHREQAPPNASYFRAGSPEDLAAVLSRVWSRLEPGPDRVSETAAAVSTQQRRLEAGRAFAAIVRDASRAWRDAHA
jgi:glycosyltransferase involved in cell wall biosynthesis